MAGRVDELERRVADLLNQLAKDFADLDAVRWEVARAAIHQAVHFATAKPGVEFCALATHLGDMVGHGHKLAHGDNPKASSHKDLVH